MLSLDDIITQHYGDGVVDLVKIDVEGSEWDIIDSRALSKLSQCQFVLIEVHPRPQRTEQELTAFMAHHGLQPTGIISSTAMDVRMFEKLP